VQTLSLLAEVGHIEDLGMLDINSYFPLAEEHKINVHTKVFPLLQVELSALIQETILSFHYVHNEPIILIM
jgi:hypothetical protein